MPRSKRSKLVTLAQTDKKGRVNKERIFDEIREGLDAYKHVFVLKLDDIRTPVLQEIRSDWNESKLILGKRKVLQKALGESPSDEYKDNLHKLSKLCEGLVGLLLTNEDVKTVEEYFNSYSKKDYSRINSTSPIDFTIPQGIVYSRGGQISEEEDVPMSHSLEETFRNKYKVPTKIKQGKIFLEAPFPVVKKGDKLNVTQSLILKQFGIAESEFRIPLVAYYDGDSAEVATY